MPPTKAVSANLDRDFMGLTLVDSSFGRDVNRPSTGSTPCTRLPLGKTNHRDQKRLVPGASGKRQAPWTGGLFRKDDSKMPGSEVERGAGGQPSGGSPNLNLRVPRTRSDGGASGRGNIRPPMNHEHAASWTDHPRRFGNERLRLWKVQDVEKKAGIAASRRQPKAIRNDIPQIHLHIIQPIQSTSNHRSKAG